MSQPVDDGHVATEVRIKGKRNWLVERFTSNIDPADEEECVALLRRRARELRLDVNDLTLEVFVKRRPRTYRA
jgi:hypothetical protein